MTKAKKNLKKVAHGAKTAGKGSLVVLVVAFFGSIFILFLTLLGLRKRPKKKKPSGKKRT